MYKCKECNAEYEIKPEYCDCGNDTFEEIVTVVAEKQSENTKIEEEKQKKPEALNGNNPVKQNTSAIHPYAIIIFISCIILSLVVILFVGNPKSKSVGKNINASKKISEKTNIPSIDKIWNDSIIEKKYINKTLEPPKSEITSETKIKIENKKTQDQKINKTSKPQIQQKTQSKELSKVKEQPTATKNTQPNQIKNTTSNNVISNPQEIEKYKISLRNYIASKIDFAAVVGDGNCTFSFKVSNNGILTNKSTVKLSDNSSLNDAVYNALRQVQSYNSPPNGYKSETLNLTVKMYNNNFEVSLR